MFIRLISAAVALTLFFIVFTLFKTPGLLAVCTLVFLATQYEYWNLSLRREGHGLKSFLLYSVLTASVFTATVFDPTSAMPVLAVCAAAFWSYSLFQIRRNKSLEISGRFQTLGSLGLLYCGVFPGMAAHFARHTHWFFALLIIVFAGDTFAYLTGRLLGRHKLFPLVSPNKTVEGAVGGLIGSLLLGWIWFRYFIPEVPGALVCIAAITTGFFAQLGDLFESQLKRIAGVKDSGKWMPGHGGMLDRLDGIYFGAPILYAFFWAGSHWLNLY